jgi:hypothetical protein
LQAADNAELLTSEDIQRIMALLEAWERSPEEFQSGKAGKRGRQTIKNMIIAAIVFYAGAVADNYSQKSPLVNKISDFLVRQEKNITNMFKGSPDDIRHSVEETIEDAKSADGRFQEKQ